VPELVRRAIENGTKNLTPEAVKAVLADLKGDLKVSRETLNSTISQIDETKNIVAKALSREFRELLDRTSVSEELAKALSLLTLELKMEVRFKPSTIAAPEKKGSPVGASVRVRRSDAPEAGSTPDDDSRDT
jgi:hypothetical protein